MDTKQQDRVVEAEVVEETAMARRGPAPVSFFQLATAGAKSPVDAIEQFAAVLDRVKIASLSLTGPQHWVRMGEGDAEHAYLKQSGASALAQFYGIKVDFFPKNVSGNADPERFEVEGKTGVFGYRITARAKSDRLEREVEVVAERRSDEEFAGRKDAPRGTRGDDYNNAQALDGDLRSAVLRLGMKKAIGELCGCGTVALAELKEAWGKQTGKKVEMIAKGAGHGSKADRVAAAVTTEDVKLEQEVLYIALGRAVAGDQAAGEQLCFDITKWTKDGKEFGWKEPNKLTEQWKIDNAWKNFAKHPVFGKSCPSPAERDKIRAEIKAEAAAGGAK
jgi:hypothetical protein